MTTRPRQKTVGSEREGSWQLDRREVVGGRRPREEVGVDPRTGTVKHQTLEQRGEAAWDRVQRQ